jgi:universal stress protein E
VFDELVVPEDAADIDIHNHLVHGHAADAIADVAARTRAGVVVLGTLARAGLPGLIIGNTAERVLGMLEASIIAVKPPGFVSPVPPARRPSRPGLEDARPAEGRKND